MVREGDRIGNRDGVIVSIEKNRMIVLEDNIEYEFLINTPIVGMAIASLPQSNTDDLINDDVNNDDIQILKIKQTIMITIMIMKVKQ